MEACFKIGRPCIEKNREIKSTKGILDMYERHELKGSGSVQQEEKRKWSWKLKEG